MFAWTTTAAVCSMVAVPDTTATLPIAASNPVAEAPTILSPLNG